MKFGANLGRLIYYRETIHVDKIDEDTARDIKDKLTVLAGQAVEHFEKLPLVQDINLLNNILYEGL